MAKKILTEETEFLVGEEKVLNYILSLLFFSLFVYSVIDVLGTNFQKLNYVNFIFFIALGPAILFLVKAKSKRIYLRINKTGIFQDEKLITPWALLLNTRITQKEKVLSIQDNFMLVIEYLNPEDQVGCRRKIPLTNTQNKSEEQIMEAIQFFWKGYKYGFD